MAFQAVVDRKARIRLKEFLRDVSKTKGDFSLAMLAQTTPSLSHRWTLVVSAPWIDSSGRSSAIKFLTSKLLEYLDRNSLAALDRISTVPSGQPILEISHALDEPELHIRNWNLDGWLIPDGYLFVADPTPKTARRIVRRRA
ncbi:MAG: hypothetical protein WA655_14520 [Candidatus Korobacteraceae bacterium]